MPLVYTEDVWRALYHEPSIPDGTSYRRSFYRDQTMFTERRGWIQNAGATANRSVLVVGCAYGFLIERLLDAGFSDTWGVDPSPWVWANTSEFRADVLPRVADGTVGVDADTALAAIGAPARFFYVVDEDAASSHTEAELPAFYAGLEDLLQGGAHGRIIHIVTPEVLHVGILNKTAAEWKATAPSHTWIDTRTGAVI